MNQKFLCDFSSLVLRLGAGAFMLPHGIAKFKDLLGSEPIKFLDPIGLGAHTSLVLACFAELVCSVLIILGLFTRVASGILIFNMFIAAFVALAGAAYSVREPALLYLFIYILVFIMGSKRFSVTGIFSEKCSVCSRLNEF